MKISTQFRVYYLIFFVVLCAGCLFIVQLGESALPFAFVVGPAYLLLGQLMIMSKISTTVCPGCGESLAYQKQGSPAFTFVRNILFQARCSKCGSEI